MHIHTVLALEYGSNNWSWSYSESKFQPKMGPQSVLQPQAPEINRPRFHTHDVVSLKSAKCESLPFSGCCCRLVCSCAGLCRSLGCVPSCCSGATQHTLSTQTDTRHSFEPFDASPSLAFICILPQPRSRSRRPPPSFPSAQAQQPASSSSPPSSQPWRWPLPSATSRRSHPTHAMHSTKRWPRRQCRQTTQRAFSNLHNIVRSQPASSAPSLSGSSSTERAVTASPHTTAQRDNCAYDHV
jgi:hypothetical protein